MPDNRNEITMEYRDHDGRQHRMTVDTDHTGLSFLEAFRSFLYVCGFQPQTVADLLRDEDENPPF